MQLRSGAHGQELKNYSWQAIEIEEEEQDEARLESWAVLLNN